MHRMWWRGRDRVPRSQRSSLPDTRLLQGYSGCLSVTRREEKPVLRCIVFLLYSMWLIGDKLQQTPTKNALINHVMASSYVPCIDMDSLSFLPLYCKNIATVRVISAFARRLQTTKYIVTCTSNLPDTYK